MWYTDFMCSQFSRFCALLAILALLAPAVCALPLLPSAFVPQFGNPFDASVWSFAAHAPLLATGGATGVQIWDTQTWRLKRNIAISREDPNRSPSARAITLSSDGKTLAAVDADGRIEIWNTASGTKRRDVAGANASALLFSPDGKEIIGCGPGQGKYYQRGQTTFWNVQTGKERLRLPLGGSDLALSANGQTVAVSGYANSMAESRVTLWNANTGQKLGTLADKSGVLGPMSFSPDGKKIVTVGEDPNWKPPSGGPFGEAAYAHTLTLKLWDVKTQTRRRVLQGQGNQFGQGLYWSRDGRHIISVSWFALVYSADGNLERQVADMGRAAMLSGDGETLIAPSTEGVVSLNIRTGKRQTLPHHFFEPTFVKAAAFSPTGSLLATGEESAGGVISGARLWSANQAQQSSHRFVFPHLYTVFFLPDGQSLVTAGEQKIGVWDALTGSAKRTFTNGQSETIDSMSPNFAKFMEGVYLLLSPDGKTLVRKSGESEARTADVIDTATDKMRASLPGMEQPLYQGVISADGTLLANANGNRTGPVPPDPPVVTVWSLRDGQRLYNFPLLSPQHSSYAFSPDSRTLAVSDYTEQQKDNSPRSIASRVTLYSLADGRAKRTLKLGKESVYAVQFMPNGQTLAISQAGMVKLLDLTTGRISQTLALPTEGLRALAFSPDGAQLVTQGFQGTGQGSLCLTHLWRIRDGRLLLTFTGLTVNGSPTDDWLAWTPAGVYDCSPGGRAAIWTQTTPQPDLVQKAFRAK